MKTVKAVAPFLHKGGWHRGGVNFKTHVYEAWLREGGQVSPSHYPPKFLRGLSFKYELPSLCRNRDEARLRFVQPLSLSFDTFPDYVRYEIIPMVWDCWPRYVEKTCAWMERHKVKAAIFTSSQTAEKIRERLPQLQVLTITEGIDTSRYLEGQPLVSRSIDLLEFGRNNDNVFRSAFPEHINHICTKQNGKYIYTNDELLQVLGDAKVTIALPRCDTEPELAGNIETLTQRYWENMLSRIVMVGRVPRELTELIGYDPVIALDREHPNEQILDILAHIQDYQPLVDKNRETALRMGDWSLRIKQIMQFLQDENYFLTSTST